MNKFELVSGIAERAGVSKRLAEKCLDAALETVAAALESGDRVQLVGFGTFEAKTMAAKVGRNPKTNEEVPIPARRSPVFKAGKYLKDRVSQRQVQG